MSQTVTLTIDGRTITVNRGTTVLQAALAHDIHLPFFCYHPGLSIDGSCRACLVSIEKMAKLQTACSTVCLDGMVVSTSNPEAVDARAGVLEFLLLNHPLDCPVCDKGGECPLQDFSYADGPARTRFEYSKRTFDGESVACDIDFGPTLMLNRNRCILCSRCVRFMREVDGDPQIGFVQRGYDSHIATFQDGGVHSPLSGNLMDVCPVGALTTKDYRFRSRPWDNLAAVDTICTRCAKGCSTTAWIKAKAEWVRGPSLVRFTPRLNPSVNGYWMCDIGRFDFHWVEGPRRSLRPLARDAAGVLHPVAWEELFTRLGERMSAEVVASIRFLVSAHASSEELYVLRRTVEGLGRDPLEVVTLGWQSSEKSQPANTAFRIAAVDAPNIRGAQDLGLLRPGPLTSRADLSSLMHAIARGELRALYVFDPGPDGSMGDLSGIVDARATGSLPLLIVQGVVMTALARAADFVLPGAAWVEKAASFTNEQGLVQTSARVIPPPGDAMEDWRILVNVAKALHLSAQDTSLVQIRSDIAASLADKPEYSVITSPVTVGAPAVRTWLETSNVAERWKWDALFQDRPPVQLAGPPEPSSWPTAGERAVPAPKKTS